MTDAENAARLLAEALGPEMRSPDHRFAANVRLAIAEEMRFRNWRITALRRIGSDALVLFGLAGPALGVARILSAGAGVGVPAVVALVATVVVGGWLTMNGEFGRSFA